MGTVFANSIDCGVGCEYTKPESASKKILKTCLSMILL